MFYNVPSWENSKCVVLGLSYMVANISGILKWIKGCEGKLFTILVIRMSVPD